MSRRLFILGSTGSIGRSAVDVVEHLASTEPERSFRVVGLAAGKDYRALAEQAARLGVEVAAIAETSDDGNCDPAWYSGPRSAERMIREHAKKGDLVLCAIVGIAGVESVLAAIDCGCDVALANKESLVAAGEIVMGAAYRQGVNIIPVDSEHSAILQCLPAGCTDQVRRITLTASGGPLRNAPREEITNATVDQVLDHPTWNMGPKVTVDSASMMNKALEVIEAHWLFSLSPERIGVVVHPQSVVHGMVEFEDGSTIAQLAPPDMRLPIQVALLWPHRLPSRWPTVDWTNAQRLDFLPVDDARFPAVSMGREVIATGGTAGAALNGANEVAVSAFLKGRIPFGAIVDTVKEAASEVPLGDGSSLEEVLATDAEARRMASAAIETRAHLA